MPTRTSRLVVLIALLCSCVQILHAQSPDFYLRITQCDNIQARVSLNGQPLHDGSCGDQLDWRPVCVNDALQPKKNRLSFEISNVLPDDFHGSLTFQLLAADSGQQTFDKFYSHTIELKDYDRFQMNIDNLIRKEGWDATTPQACTPYDFVAATNHYDSLDYFFSAQDRFYLTITRARRASYAIAMNNEYVLEGTFHINSFRDAYSLAHYPYYFLNNTFVQRDGSAHLWYRVHPEEGYHTAEFEIVLYHYPPLSNDPQILGRINVTCQNGETKEGEFDFTEVLSRHGYFKP